MRKDPPALSDRASPFSILSERGGDIEGREGNLGRAAKQNSRSGGEEGKSDRGWKTDAQIHPWKGEGKRERKEPAECRSNRGKQIPWKRVVGPTPGMFSAREVRSRKTWDAGSKGNGTRKKLHREGTLRES